MDINVIDNFLEKKEYEFIYGEIVDGRFPWFLNSVVNEGKKIVEDIHNFQFTHLFYANYAPTSNYIEIINPLIEKINPSALIRIKANLNTRTEKNIEHGFHCDYLFDSSKTCVYYLNTNNGYTLFEDGTRVESVANRMVEFESKIMHTGSTATDKKIRAVINLNYFK